MKATAITLLALLLPLQAQAQPVELTLICQGERTFNLVNNPNLPLPWSGSFTAIVRMHTVGDDDGACRSVGACGVAMVDVNLGDRGPDDCEHFGGTFSELDVRVMCINTKTPNLLSIDRIDGAFKLVIRNRGIEPVVEYDGHCKPSKKLF
jgi:hypothetical protein